MGDYVKLFGATGENCQLIRINRELRKMGFVTLPAESCVYSHYNQFFVYCNDAGYFDEAIEYATLNSKFLILNVLDIPEHLLPSFDLEKLTKQLLSANIVTCISRTVKQQLEYFCGIDAHVIYNPVKDVYLMPERPERTNKYLYVGRANDSNKRFDLVRNFVKNPEDLTVCGSENPNFGKYVGIVSDDELNRLYNTSKFLLLPSNFEGIGLTACEAIICGCIPLLSVVNKTAKEFFPPQLILDFPNTQEEDLNYLEDVREKLCDFYRPIMKNKFSAENVAQRIATFNRQYAKNRF